MSGQVRGRWRRPVAVAVAVVTLVAACSSGDDDDGAPRPTGDGATLVAIGHGVLASLPRGGGALVATPVTAPAALAGVERAAPVFDVTEPDGAGQGPITIAIPVEDVAPGDAVVVMTAEAPDGPWEAIEATVEDGRARFVTPHLSLFSVVPVSLGWLRDRVQDLFDGFTSEVFRETEQPTCADEDGARTDGWTVGSSGPDTLRWCFGRDDDGRFLTVADNRRYPLALSTAGPLTLAPAVDPLLAESLAEVIERALGAGGEVLVAREAVTYRLGDLAEGSSARVRTEYDGFAQALGTIQYATEALLSILTRFGLSSSRGAAEVLADVVSAPGCVDALTGQDLAGLVRTCLDGADLTRLFGATGGVVAALVVAVGGFLAFLAQSAQAVWDQVTGGDRYTVTVARSTAAPGWDEVARARIPSLCDHPATTLVDGVHTGIAPNRGVFELQRTLYAGGSGLAAGLPSDAGPLTVVAATCNAGGVGWPTLLVAFGPGGEYYGSTDLLDAEWYRFGLDGPARDGVTALRVEGDVVRVDVDAYTPDDALCCASQAATAFVRAAGGQLVVDRLESAYDGYGGDGVPPECSEAIFEGRPEPELCAQYR